MTTETMPPPTGHRYTRPWDCSRRRYPDRFQQDWHCHAYAPGIQRHLNSATPAERLAALALYRSYRRASTRFVARATVFLILMKMDTRRTEQ